MGVTVTDVYNVRFCDKLKLPEFVQNSISKLRLTPAVYKPVRVNKRNHTYKSRRNNTNISQNWESLRKDQLEDYVRKVKQQDDSDYSEIFRIFNKVAPANLEQLTLEVIKIIEKRDDDFRLRVSILLFDRAITQPTFSEVMAESARFISIVIPEIVEDLQAQISMFPKLYDMTETITIDISNTINPQDEKLIAWTKQKEKRRGYARFMMALFSKELIEESVVKNALEQIISDVELTSKQPKTSQTEENITQYVEFIFEASSKVKGELKVSLAEYVQKLLSIPKAELPSLNMRSKFKLEDALKKLNIKE